MAVACLKSHNELGLFPLCGPRSGVEMRIIDRLATLVPSPRVHRHRYFGVLPPDSPLQLSRLYPARRRWGAAFAASYGRFRRAILSAVGLDDSLPGRGRFALVKRMDVVH